MIKVRYIVLALVAALAAGTIYDGVFMTDAGHVSIHKRMGRVVAEKAPGGPYFKIPFVDTVDKMNVRTLDNGVTVKGRTADQQELDVIVAVQWSIAPNSKKGAQDLEAQQDGEVQQYVGDASYVMVTYGSREAFDKNILDRRITKVTTDFIATKKLEDIVKERAKFTRDIENTLGDILADYPIVVDGIQVIDIKPSKKYTDAIEAKQIAEVNAQKAIEEAKGINTLAEANKNKVQKEADAYAYGVQVKAQADATGITAKADALAKAGDTYIEFTKITQWDGVLPKVVTGGNDGIGFGVGATIGQNVVKDVK